MAIEPKKYETLYLVRPDISPEDLLTVQNRVEQSVAGNGGEMVKSEKWAERDLAYRIDNYTRGTYYIAVYSAEPKAVTDIERYFNLSKNNVLRFITVQYIEEQKPAGAAGSTTPQTSQQEDQSAFQTPSIPEEPPQASKRAQASRSRQASKEPPQASKEPPQASKEPPQASKEPPQASEEPPQASKEPPQASEESAGRRRQAKSKLREEANHEQKTNGRRRKKILLTQKETQRPRQRRQTDRLQRYGTSLSVHNREKEDTAQEKHRTFQAGAEKSGNRNKKSPFHGTFAVYGNSQVIPGYRLTDTRR